VAERNGAEGLNAATGLDDTSYFWSMPRIVWSFGPA